MHGRQRFKPPIWVNAMRSLALEEMNPITRSHACVAYVCACVQARSKHTTGMFVIHSNFGSRNLAV